MDSSKTEPPRHLQGSKHYPSMARSAQAFTGESRMEYIPIEKTILEYQPVTKVQYIPREKKIVQYQPVEYQMQYIPQIYYQKIIDYVPVQRMEERIEYVPVQRQIYHPTQNSPYSPYENSYPPYSHSVPSSYTVTSSERKHEYSGHGAPAVSRIQPPKQMHQDMSFQNIHQSEYIKEPLPSSKRSRKDRD